MIAPKETESQFGSWLEDWMRLKGYRFAHFRPAQIRQGRYVTAMSGDVGFPDYAIVGKGKFLLRETKMDGKYPTPEQRLWLADLTAAGVDAGVWKPKDRSDVMRVLA